MKVVVLGAGASKAYSRSPTKVRMPIATDFFDTFDKLEISANPWVLQEGLIDFLGRVKGVDPWSFLRSGINIEELHSEIEEYLRHAMEDGDRLNRVLLFRPYNELIYIFSSVVNEIQNGPISDVHCRLAKLLEPNDVVVTFNWDTLMDRALASAGDWSVDNGYGFWPRSVYRNDWVAPTARAGEKDSVKLLKLHGSSNWITSHPMFHEDKVTLMQDAAPDAVWVYEDTQDPYDCYAGRYMSGYEPFSYGYYPPNILDDSGKPAPEGHTIVRLRIKLPWKPDGAAGAKGLVSMPLIIPPVRHKRYDLYGPLFDDLWHQAQFALQRAEQIFIIGYSFPKTDIRSTELFNSAFMAQDTIPCVTVVNPTPEDIVHKVQLEFGIPAENVTLHKDYLSDNFDIEGLIAKG